MGDSGFLVLDIELWGLKHSGYQDLQFWTLSFGVPDLQNIRICGSGLGLRAQLGLGGGALGLRFPQMNMEAHRGPYI